MAASRKLDTYEIPLDDRDKRDYAAIRNAIDKRLPITGVGMCDEVLAIIHEQDGKTAENFGLKESKDELVFCKIDYDWCTCWCSDKNTNWLGSKMRDAEMLRSSKILSDTLQKRVGIVLTTSEQYLLERLYARLKVALFPIQLISSLAEKCFTEGYGDKDDAIRSLGSVIDIALEAFLQEPQSRALMAAGKIQVEAIHQELVVYSRRHFDAENCVGVLKGLTERLELVREKIKVREQTYNRAMLVFFAGHHYPRATQNNMSITSKMDRNPNNENDDAPPRGRVI